MLFHELNHLIPAEDGGSALCPAGSSDDIDLELVFTLRSGNLPNNIGKHTLKSEDLKALFKIAFCGTPGFIFGTQGERYIRISLCAKEENLKEALERIKKAI